MIDFNSLLNGIPGYVILGLVIAFVWRFGGWKKDLDRLVEWSKKVDDKLEKIFERLPRPAADTESPLKLNDLGKKVSSELEAKDWARRNINHISPKVLGLEKYDIQKFCFDYVTIDKFDEKQQKLIKRVAYDNGMPLVDVLEVVGLELRDELLETRESA